jgi:hypothetical protein
VCHPATEWRLVKLLTWSRCRVISGSRVGVDYKQGSSGQLKLFAELQIPTQALDSPGFQPSKDDVEKCDQVGRRAASSSSFQQHVSSDSRVLFTSSTLEAGIKEATPPTRTGKR